MPARKINTKDMQIVRQRRPLGAKLCPLQRMIGMYCALKKRVASSKRFLLTENCGISLHFFYWPRKNIEQNFYFKMSIKSFGKVFEKMLGTSLIISKCRVLQVSLIRCRILRLFGPQKIHSMGFHGNPSRLHHYKCWIFVKV